MILNAVLCEREHDAGTGSTHAQAAALQSRQERNSQRVILASHTKQVQRHAVSFRSRCNFAKTGDSANGGRLLGGCADWMSLRGGQELSSFIRMIPVPNIV